jgi:hypothetical protein
MTAPVTAIAAVIETAGRLSRRPAMPQSERIVVGAILFRGSRQSEPG